MLVPVEKARVRVHVSSAKTTENSTSVKVCPGMWLFLKILNPKLHSPVWFDGLVEVLVSQRHPVDEMSRCTCFQISLARFRIA